MMAEAENNPIFEQQVPFKCVALYKYKTDEEDELEFVPGDDIIITKAEGKWLEGKLNGKTGLVPYNYVEVKKDQVSAELTAIQGSTTYDDDDEVVKPVPGDEIKRQELIRELINSEKAYVKHLIQTSQFDESLEKSGLLTTEESSTVFGSFKEVLQCNLTLEMLFKERKRKSHIGSIEMIGDLLSEQLHNFVSPYSKFCDQQVKACQLVKEKIKTWNSNKKFQLLHKPKGCLDPRTYGQLLINDLQKPLERILSYERLIKKLLKCTPEDHHDHAYLQSALKNAVILSKKVERFQSEETSNGDEWLQSHVNQKDLLGLFIFKTSTKSLVSRKLIYTGKLYEVKSNKELKAFLFNDFLLLMQPESSLTGGVLKKKQNSKKPRTQYTIYKNPLFLKEVTVSGRPVFDFEDCSFQIFLQDKSYTFKTDTGLEREKWIKNLEKAAEHYIQTEKKKESVLQKGE